MSELKAMAVLNVQQMGCYDNALVYFKSEADKVIAEKDAEIVELKKQVHDYAQGLYVMRAKAEKEARHQKYRWCLAMANWCDAEGCWYENQGEDIKASWFFKWEHKWLKLAEKFKPNNSTAQ